MIAADRAIQRPATARLLVVDAAGRLTHAPRARWTDFLVEGDLVVANDAATLPASLAGTHVRSGAAIELRLAAWHSPPLQSPLTFDAIVFGAGDFRMRTEDRPPAPRLARGHRLRFGDLTATVERTFDSPRLVRVRFDVSTATFWRWLAAHGSPIQYSHLREPLAMWDTWTSIAAMPVAFEPPSAGFVLDWQTVAALASRGIGFETLTHAAGVSSTGDAALDRCLPFDEWYSIPGRTVRAIRADQARGARVIAIGTTVVRALEDAAAHPTGLAAGNGIAAGSIGADTDLHVVDGIVTGTHERGGSHHELLRAFASDSVLATAACALERHGYRTHEFGDSMLVFRAAVSLRRLAGALRTDDRRSLVGQPEQCA